MALVDGAAGYELLDAGDGRRLERFGAVVVDRPAATATDPPRDPAAWAEATFRFDRWAGWTAVPAGDPEPESWVVPLGDQRFELRLTDSGQVGLFPEQAPNRAWIRDACAEIGGAPTVLNLFAYTGATTLAAAAAGAAVTHVDGSKPSVAWARRNAELSSLADRPIRWIVDDVEGFVRREARRERTYDGLALDPPSYGHGGRSRAGGWRIEKRLDDLLDACVTLTGRDPAFVVLSAHTPGIGPSELSAALARAFRRPARLVEAGELGLRARSGAHLRLGAFARIIRG
jgi:23S rRNA (cytosine1962-C5)-methyltransferase